jgi:hypothetical protein
MRNIILATTAAILAVPALSCTIPAAHADECTAITNPQDRATCEGNPINVQRNWNPQPMIQGPPGSVETLTDQTPCPDVHSPTCSIDPAPPAGGVIAP